MLQLGSEIVQTLIAFLTKGGILFPYFHNHSSLKQEFYFCLDATLMVFLFNLLQIKADFLEILQKELLLRIKQKKVKYSMF